jgi:signal recognition particle subunit SRP54
MAFMFEKLTSGLNKIFEKLTGTGYLTEASVDEALQEVRVALLDADVALPVVKEFSKLVKEKATGEKILKSISPGQLVIKIVQDCLVEVLSTGSSELNLKCAPPAVILIAGLQGSGKTTTSAKLANKLKLNGKKVLLASIDIARPAAQEQLEVLAGQVQVDYFQIESRKPQVLKLTKEILQRAQNYDVLIMDTAGRLHVDDDLMQEIKQVHALLSPVETLLVVDSLTGQDAINIARVFGSAIQLTGLILTRMDSDARGGAALSLGYMTKCPIKFLGVGEKISDLEQFHADRLASRILDMGDVVSLVEKAKEAIDEAESEAMIKKMESGNFDLNMMAEQLRGIKKMGGLSSLMKLIPGLNKLSQQLPIDMSEDAVNKSLAIILSMTKEERALPEVFNASRKKRVAAGSGTSIHDVNKLLKQFTHMSKTLRRMKNFESNPSALTRHLPPGIKDLFS